MKLLRILVNGLIKHERLETTFAKAAEAQKYMDRLIEIAKRGRSEAYAKDMVDYWADDENKTKLYNVLVPRYSKQKQNFTRLAILSQDWIGPRTGFHQQRMAVIELKGNLLPPLPVAEKNPHTLQNVLISAAKADWERERLNRTSNETEV